MPRVILLPASESNMDARSEQWAKEYKADIDALAALDADIASCKARAGKLRAEAKERDAEARKLQKARAALAKKLEDARPKAAKRPREDSEEDELSVGSERKRVQEFQKIRYRPRQKRTESEDEAVNAPVSADEDEDPVVDTASEDSWQADDREPVKVWPKEAYPTEPRLFDDVPTSESEAEEESSSGAETSEDDSEVPSELLEDDTGSSSEDEELITMEPQMPKSLAPKYDKTNGRWCAECADYRAPEADFTAWGKANERCTRHTSSSGFGAAAATKPPNLPRVGRGEVDI